MKKIAIIGAGLSGLTTAFYLKQMGYHPVVFECKDRIGGVIHTTKENGFLYESGPNSGVISHPETIELIDDLDGSCELEIADNAAKKRWIWKKNRWHALPAGPLSAISTPLFTLKDKLRILGEPLRKKGDNPNEPLNELVLRRLGKSFLDYAVDPFVLGIYAGDPSLLVPKYALPKLYNLEQNYGSFIRGAIKKKKETKSAREKLATREIFSTKGGLSELIQALSAKIEMQNIRTGIENLTIAPCDNSFKILNNTHSLGVYDYVVNTAGSYAFETIFPFLEKNEMRDLTAMHYAPVIQCGIGFKNWEGIPLDAFGGLVPFKENRNILGALFLSTIFENRAPKNGALLSVFLGGMRKPDLVTKSDDEIKNLVENELKSMFQLKNFEPELFKIHRYHHAIPQYGPESEAKLEAIKKVEKQFPGLILAGNTRDGIGMSDRIKQGKETAMELNKTIKATLES